MTLDIFGANLLPTTGSRPVKRVVQNGVGRSDPSKMRAIPHNAILQQLGFLGNVISGLIGGLPVTQVIVRSSANAQSGGKTKRSAMIHGFLLLFTVLLIPSVLKMIPMATLAAILFVVGYKLARPEIFKKMKV